MKCKNLIICLFCLVWWSTLVSFNTEGDTVFAMSVDDLDFSRRIDWTKAGYPGNIPNISTNIINVKNIGARGDGWSDDFSAIQSAIDSAPDPTVIFFPAGTYRIKSQLSLKSGIVLRGEGSLKTHLEFLSASGCFGINGRTTGSYVNILSGLEKGSDKIVVSDASNFSVGQGGEIRQEDIVAPAASWGAYAVGQMVKIVKINGNTLTINPPLHIDLDSSKSPEILAVRYVKRVGIEDLHIKRIDSGHDSTNVTINRAADCWIRRVESENTLKYHFSIARSLHLEIRDSYIHESKSKGDGGQGYGTSLSRYVTSVLVENNIFSELRHAMIVQIGVNGCVFGYNYAERNYSDDGWDKTYISIHGHYPFMNLYEGNIVGRIGIADYWGPSGPGNTFFRNRVKGTDKHKDFGPYRGIEVDDYSHDQNIIANELTGNQTKITFDGNDDPSQGTSNDVLVHGNNVHGTITWAPSVPDRILPASFYLTSKPDFFGAVNWPPMGGDKPLGQGTIPAEVRRKSGNYVPQPKDLAGPPAPTNLRILP